MPKALIYKGRDWKWWLVLNGHCCRFCHDANKHVSLGRIVYETTGKGQYDVGYWNALKKVWLNHMKEVHGWVP